MTRRDPNAWRYHTAAGEVSRPSSPGELVGVGEHGLRLMRIAWRSRSGGVLVQQGDRTALAAAHRLVTAGVLDYGKFGNRSVGYLHAFILTDLGRRATLMVLADTPRRVGRSR